MAAPAPAPAPAEKLAPPAEKKIEKQTSASATIVVTLPADARLTVDGVVTTSVSARREFVSPALPVGQTFSYTLKAEYTANGTPVVVSRAVEVKAGVEVNVELFSAEAVASR